VSGVLTEHGEIKSQAVLCAGGAWTTFLLKGCGIRLPQLTVKASVVRTAPTAMRFKGNASGSKISTSKSFPPRRTSDSWWISCP